MNKDWHEIHAEMIIDGTFIPVRAKPTKQDSDEAWAVIQSAEFTKLRERSSIDEIRRLIAALRKAILLGSIQYHHGSLGHGVDMKDAGVDDTARSLIQAARDALYADDPTDGWKDIIDRMDTWLVRRPGIACPHCGKHHPPDGMCAR